ncbi:MAG: hypothetical protein EKK62_05850, partial [Acidimicrobiia bacterium]
AAGPGQTTNQGFRGGMLPGPAPDFIEGEFSDVTGQPQAPGFGGPGFEQQIRPQAAGAAGMIGEWPAGPAPVAPSAPTDLLALPAPSLAPAAGPAPDYYMPPAIGPLTTAVRAAVSQQQAGAPTSIAGLLPAPVAAPVATAPAATTAAPALPQMPYPRPALPAFAGSTAPSIPASTPAPQPQPQEASHAQGQGQAEAEALLSGEKGAGAAAAQPAAAPAPIKTERAAKAAAARKSKSTGKPHEAVAVDGGWRVQQVAPATEQGQPLPALKKKRKPVQINERKDTLLTAIAKAGGLSREEAAAHGIDPADFRRPSGVFGQPIFRKSGGMSLDGMAELLHQYGYPVTDERGNYSPNVLLDRIGDELRGQSVRTPEGLDAQAQADQAQREHDRAMREQDAADAYGMTDDPFEFSDAELEASGYADADDSTRRVAEIIAEAKTRLDSDIVEDIAERVATQTDARGATDEEFIAELEAALRGQETNDTAGQAQGNPDRPDAGSDAQGEEFTLGSYSEADIARREAEAVAAREREEKARKAAEDRARAERDRGQFELTGSDRPADANPRQSDLLDLTGRPGSAPAAESPRKSDVASPEPAAGQPVEPAAEPVTAADGYGARNTLFTADAAEQARALLRKKLGQLNAGLDPEIVQAGITLAGYHIEAGARSFAAYTKAMIADLGEAARPYLRSWYEGVRYYPNMDAAGMTPAAEIEAQRDAPASDAAAAQPPEPTPTPTPAKTRSAPKERTQKEQKAKPAIISGYSDQHPEWVKYWEEKSVGRTVYSNATEGIALMEGSNLLTGAPVYTAIMRSGELSARVDIDSYTGRDLTEAQRAELSQAKQRHVEFDAREHAARPDGPFKDGERFAYSGDIPAKVAGVARDWLRLVGIDARVFLTTEHGTRGKSDQYGLYGPFAPIRSAAFSPEEGGSTRKLSNGDHYIVLSKQVLDNDTQWPETLAHEIGHVLEKVAYQQADVATKNAIIGAYNRWITHQKTGGPGGGIVSMEDLVRNVRAASMAEAAIASARERGIDTSLPASEMSNAGYFSSFSEWFADQVSRWAVSSETPQSVVGKFFKAIANKLRKLYAAASGKRYLPSDEMKAWLDARAAANPLQGAAELQEEPGDDAGSSPDLERHRRDAAAGDGVGARGVQDGAAGDGGSAGPRVRGAEEAGSRSAGGSGVVDGETVDAGGAGHQWLSDRNEPAGPDDGAAGRGVSGRGDGTGDAGVPDDPAAGAAVAGAAAQAESRPVDLNAKRAAQAAAQGVPVRAGDADNIRESLPFLLDGQRDDVLFAEERFAKPDGYGVLFTNGTGTGKTFTSLGIAKRFERAGKRNILVVVPNQTLADDYAAAAKNLLIDIEALPDTKTAGRGPVITTYAALGQNDALMARDWDLVIADESQNLSQAADGGNTLALDRLRALALHPDGVAVRHAVLYADDIAAEKDLAARVTANSDRANYRTTTSAEAARLLAENDRLRPELAAAQEKNRKSREAVAADVEARQGAARPRVVMLSATPFAYRESIQYANGFLLDFPKPSGGGRYNSPKTPLEAFLVRQFGYRMRFGKITKPRAEVDTDLMEVEFNAQLRSSGALSWRGLSVDADYDRRFLVAQDAVGRRIDEGLEWLREQARAGRYTELHPWINNRFSYLSRVQLLEAIKAKAAIPYIRASLEAGRKVVVFHNYNVGGGFHPFQLGSIGEPAEGQPMSPLQRQYADFRRERPDLVGLDLSGLNTPIETLTRAFPEALLFNGSVPAKQRVANKGLFNSDDGKHRVILVQADAGGAGLSLHDTTGKYQRVLLNLGLPVRPVTAIQQEGRIYRVGQVTDAVIRYMNTGTNFERFAFAQKIAERAGTVENLGIGQAARDLKRAFIDAFTDAREEAPSTADGKGGKAADREIDRALSPFDKAKTHYFAQQK